MADIPYEPEQDTSGGDGLPTYEDLAAEKGPNSRFGRWKGWIEKRAAERYIDITPEERTRRRERGWGVDNGGTESSFSRLTLSTQSLRVPSAHGQSAPSIHSNWSDNTVQVSNYDPPSYCLDEPETPSIPIPSESIHPSHLKICSFGSRFLPHTTSPIRALLPLTGDRYMLIGHENGLSVMDLFPTGDPDTSNPSDAIVRPIWEGEGVFQLEVLEFQDTGDVTPQGVVLALVGSEVETPNSRERDIVRSIRMYNLASLTSLARYCIAQKDSKPLDLRRPSNWSPQQTYTKKHKHNSSISKFKNMITDSNGTPEPHTSYPSASKQMASPMRRGTSATSADSGWDVVDDLPLRWATDFVPLAIPGSRLLNFNVLFFELRRDEVNGSRGSSTLAIATKQNILLYETPKGERAFRFVKEFYAPLPPRNISFVQQRAQDTVLLRTPSNASQASVDIDSPSRRFSLRPSLEVSRDRHRERSTSPSPDYGNQLSLFVVFEKKAGLIRLADSAVGEVELFEESPKDISSPLATSPRRSFVRETKGHWLPPSYEELPSPSSNSSSQGIHSVYLLTRGKQTHVVPYPIPTPLSSTPPLCVLTWQYPPTQICNRICFPRNEPSFLQVIGLGEYGIEVQEVPLSTFSKGKGKSRGEEIVRAHTDIGGDTGYFCRGGMWHKPPQHLLLRSDSVMSYSSSTTALVDKKKAEEGFYAWCRRDLEDWRIFWLGGVERDNDTITDS